MGSKTRQYVLATSVGLVTVCLLYGMVKAHVRQSPDAPLRAELPGALRKAAARLRARFGGAASAAPEPLATGLDRAALLAVLDELIESRAKTRELEVQLLQLLMTGVISEPAELYERIAKKLPESVLAKHGLSEAELEEAITKFNADDEIYEKALWLVDGDMEEGATIARAEPLDLSSEQTLALYRDQFEYLQEAQRLLREKVPAPRRRKEADKAFATIFVDWQLRKLHNLTVAEYCEFSDLHEAALMESDEYTELHRNFSAALESL